MQKREKMKRGKERGKEKRRTEKERGTENVAEKEGGG
jgi:hypothetical protein